MFIGSVRIGGGTTGIGIWHVSSRIWHEDQNGICEMA